MTDDGATKLPDDNMQAPECMGRYKHYWHWVWKDGQMTEDQTCSTCGAIRTIPNLKELP